MIDPFSYKDVRFPKDFLFGAATAGAQIEGNVNSHFDSSAYIEKKKKIGEAFTPAGKAEDSWNHFDEDLALLKQMKLGLYRMSIEWSRVEISPGKYDESAVIQYVEELKKLKKADIKICLTLHHFSHPTWFEEKGAFRTLNNISYFERYLQYIVPIVAPYIDYWIVLNEPNMPFQYSIAERMNLLSYHVAGYKIVKENSDKPVSSALSYSPKHPFRGSSDKLDSLMANWLDYTENEYFAHAFRTGEVSMPNHDAYVVPGLKNSIDFWAINTYIRQNIDGHKKNFHNSSYDATRLPVLSHPFYMEEMSPEIIINLASRFQDKPILISENGFAVKNDDVRIIYISEMLQEIHQALDMGYNIIGYTHWSLLDNWEWGDYSTTFGLASVDGDYQRHLKKSGEFYGKIAAQKQFTQRILREYLNQQPKLK